MNGLIPERWKPVARQVRALVTSLASSSVAIPLLVATGRVPSRLWYDLRELHPLTNGWTTDVLRRLVDRRAPPPRFSGEASPLFGALSTEMQDSIVAAMREKGWSALPFSMPPEAVAAIAAHTRAVLGTPRPTGPDAIVDFQHPKVPAYWFQAAKLRDCPAYRSIVADPLLADLARRYVGVEPVLSTCQAWWSFPTAVPSSPNAQLYHYDLDHLGWLKFFIYLTDVSEDSGPHCLIERTHHRDREGRSLRRRVRFERVSDESIAATYPGREKVFTGPAGTMFAVDTRCWHKGLPPRTAPRLAMEVYFSDCIVGDLPLEEQLRRAR